MRDYEMTVLFNIEKDLFEKSLQKLRNFFEEKNVAFQKEQDLGQRPLSYPIKNLTRGQYMVFYFASETDFLVDLKNFFLLDQDILRYLIVFYDPVAIKKERAKSERKKRYMSERANKHKGRPAQQEAETQPAQS